MALLVAEIPKWIQTMAESGDIDFATWKHIEPKSAADLVEHFDENMRGAKAALEKISDEDIQDIIQTISQVYDIQKPLLVKIADWLNDRKERIFDKCLENESCYPNVNKRGLLSAGR